MRVLVVEDDVDLADIIARVLRRDGHAVDVSYTAAESGVKVISTEYDLVALDWNLPDGSGMDLCRRLVRGDLETLGEGRPRVLMVTARDDIEDRVTGLDGGADDYLVKPFAMDELSARVRALLRRDEPTASPVIETGGLVLDPATFEASLDGNPLSLTTKEFALLHFFMTHPREVLSQETLLEHVWDEMADPFTNVVRVTISNLRKKLGATSLIETLAGRGYRLSVDSDG
ncbi:MAG: response regulator [Acidimicrobiia bacterium]|nr:response regulator [Acidimicrobiia bacterium]